MWRTRTKDANVTKTKSILHSVITSSSTLIRRNDNVITTFNQKTNTSQTFFCFFSILFQRNMKTLKNIMHLKIDKYAMNEITEKRTLLQKSKKNMSSSSRQRSVSVMQIISSQINNAFNVLRNRSNLRIKLESTSTSTTHDTQTQLTLKLKDRSSNSRKTTKSSQNEELWRHNRHSSYCSTTFETKRMKRWYFFWSIRESKNTIYWLFKNFDATSAYRRRIICSTSIFIYCIKNQKTCARVFTSTSN
jgi:hypothetical protein